MKEAFILASNNIDTTINDLLTATQKMLKDLRKIKDDLKGAD